MKRSNSNKEVVVQKIKFTEFKDSWAACSREFQRTRPKVVAIALQDALPVVSPALLLPLEIMVRQRLRRA